MDVFPRATFHFISKRFDEVGTAQRVGGIGDSAFMSDDLLRAQRDGGGKLGG